MNSAPRPDIHTKLPFALLSLCTALLLGGCGADATTEGADEDDLAETSSAIVGVWENVTPAFLDLNNTFGVFDVLADPSRPGTFFAFADMAGALRTTNWGTTWVHVSTDGKLEQGRPFAAAIAPDGSYMLSTAGFSALMGALKSTDKGVTWTSSTIGATNDPWSYAIDPANKNHVIVSMHSSDHIFESTDSALTWTDKGSPGTGMSSYVFFVNSTTWLVMDQSGGGGGTRRTTDNGNTWATVGAMEHAHGAGQIYISPTTHDIYVPNWIGGIFRSTNLGASFTQVSTAQSSAIFGTTRSLYSLVGFPAEFPPNGRKAAVINPTVWSTWTTPPGMTYGPKRVAVAFNSFSRRWTFLSGNFRGGIWRFVE